MTNLARTTAGTVPQNARSQHGQIVLAGRGGHNYSGRQIRLLHLAAIRVDRPVHEMMIFAKSLLCSFLRLGAGVGERLEGVLAGVDFVAISAKHLLKESHTKAAHCDLHCLFRHNKRVLERYLKDAFENVQILTPQAGRKSDPRRPLFSPGRPPSRWTDRFPSLVAAALLLSGPGGPLQIQIEAIPTPEI